MRAGRARPVRWFEPGRGFSPGERARLPALRAATWSARRSSCPAADRARFAASAERCAWIDSLARSIARAASSILFCTRSVSARSRWATSRSRAALACRGLLALGWPRGLPIRLIRARSAAPRRVNLLGEPLLVLGEVLEILGELRLLGLPRLVGAGRLAERLLLLAIEVAGQARRGLVAEERAEVLAGLDQRRQRRAFLAQGRPKIGSGKRQSGRHHRLVRGRQRRDRAKLRLEPLSELFDGQDQLGLLRRKSLGHSRGDGLILGMGEGPVERAPPAG